MVDIFYSRRFFIPLIILWAVSLASVLLWLQGITGDNQRLPVPVNTAQPSGNGPHSYMVSMGTDRLGQTDAFSSPGILMGTFASPAILLENGHSIGPGNAQHADVGQLGNGRFSFWKGSLIFSSSDNSDPRTNGRNYILILPGPNPPQWLGWVLLLILLLLAWFVRPSIDILKDQIHLSPRQFLRPAAFGLVIALCYFFQFFWHDSLGILLGTTILFHLWSLFSILAYWLQRKFQQFRDSVNNASDVVPGARWKHIQHRLLIHLVNHYLFYLCASVLIIVFLITRLPFFIYYPIVGVQPDSDVYVGLTTMMKSGIIPQFTMRTPGYPLFIWLITSSGNRWFPVIVAQNLLSFVSSLSLIYGVYRLWPSLALPATLAMAGFIGGSQLLFYDSNLLSDSLYTSCIIFAFAFLLLAFAVGRALYFGFASTAMAAAIIVRPSGMYFVVIYILVVCYLFWNGYRKNVVLRFLIPFPGLLLALCVYNYFTINAFTISPWGEVNLALATISYWEPDPGFPPKVNEAIEELPDFFAQRAGFTEKDQLIIQNSWNPQDLKSAFSKLDIGPFYDYAMGSRFETPQRKGYMANRELIRKVIFTSIRNHPILYAKFVWANSIIYFQNIDARFDFYAKLLASINGYYQQVSHPSANITLLFSAWEPELAKEYVDALPFGGVRAINVGGNPGIIFNDTFLKSLHVIIQSWQWNIFQRPIWIWAYFIVFGLSVIVLVVSKGRRLGTFILFILSVSAFGSYLTVSLVQVSMERYAYPTQFIYYLSVALLPLLWLNPENKTHG